MSAQELPHTLSVKRGLFMRLFLWLYEPPADRLNTCWLFWGFLLMPLLLPLIMLGKYIIVPLVEIDDRWEQRRRAQRTDELILESVSEPEPKRDSFGMKVLRKVSDVMGRLWYHIDKALPWIGLGVALIGVALAVYGFIVNPIGILEFLLRITLTMAAIVALAAVVVGVLFLVFDKFDAGHKVKSVGRNVHRHTCANVKIEGNDTQENRGGTQTVPSSGA